MGSTKLNEEGSWSSGYSGRSRWEGSRFAAARSSARCWCRCCLRAARRCRRSGCSTRSGATGRRPARRTRCRCTSRSCARPGSRSSGRERGTGFAPSRLDAAEFEELLETARAHRGSSRHEEALASLDAALALWRGPALAGLDDGDAATERERLEDLRVAALEDRAESTLALGRTLDLPELEPLVAEHPLRERLRGLLMLGLYRGGRQAEALDAYAGIRKCARRARPRARRRATSAPGRDPAPGRRARRRAGVAARAPPPARACDVVRRPAGGGRGNHGPAPR